MYTVLIFVILKVHAHFWARWKGEGVMLLILWTADVHKFLHKCLHKMLILIISEFSEQVTLIIC